MSNPSIPISPPLRRRPRRRALAAAGLAAALLAGAAPAHGSADQNVATDTAGGAHIAWRESTDSGLQVHERTIAADGSLGPAQSVSWAFRPAIYQAIGASGAGDAVIAWMSNDGATSPTYIRARSAAGALSAPQLVSPAGVTAFDPALAVEPDGDAIVVWSRFVSGKQAIQARRRAADGTLGSIQTLSYLGANSDDPEVSVTPGGTAVVAWVRQAGKDEYVQTRTIAPDGTLSATQRLSPVSASISALRTTVSDAGTAVVSWTRELDDGAFALQSRARSVTGALGVVQTVAPPEQFSGLATMAGNAAGRVVFTWRQQTPDTTYIVKGRVRQANGALGPVFEVSAGNGDEPGAAIDPDGNATFVWRVDAVTDAVQLRRRTPGGTMGPVRTVSDLSEESFGPHVAVDTTGKATVVWFLVDGVVRSSARTVAPGGDMSPIHRLGN